MLKITALRTGLVAAALAATVSVLGTTAAHAEQNVTPPAADTQLAELIAEHGVKAQLQNNPWD
ncbi:hypothetical protein [Streptomyces spiramenti]|uniref:Uncharacterized protein n=1 Tax=Streptomyces spiramenti TaxID=2720606 RepID=A0ABX1AL70_9ACTN|nr:hypothetical protein [Streptomyces spiramenti]NJP66446.1 hypothetical protein [Streptomyces spiramenti]